MERTEKEKGNLKYYFFSWVWNVCAERNIETGWFDESTVVPDVDPVHDGGVCGAAADPHPLWGPGLSVIRRPRHHLCKVRIQELIKQVV